MAAPKKTQQKQPTRASIYKGTDKNSKGPKMPATANGKYVGGGPTYKIVDNVRFAVDERGRLLKDLPKNKVAKAAPRRGLK